MKPVYVRGGDEEFFFSRAVDIRSTGRQLHIIYEDTHEVRHSQSIDWPFQVAIGARVNRDSDEKIF